VSTRILTGKRRSVIEYKTENVSKRLSSWQTADSGQQSRRDNGVVDDSDETDRCRRRTDGERSVMPGVSRRSNQYLNRMWSAYRSSDSSRQCHGRTTQRNSTMTSPVVSLGNSLPPSLRVSKRSLPAHSARSQLGVSPRLTALSIFTQQSLTCK